MHILQFHLYDPREFSVFKTLIAIAAICIIGDTAYFLWGEYQQYAANEHAKARSLILSQARFIENCGKLISDARKIQITNPEHYKSISVTADFDRCETRLSVEQREPEIEQARLAANQAIEKSQKTACAIGFDYALKIRASFPNLYQKVIATDRFKDCLSNLNQASCSKLISDTEKMRDFNPNRYSVVTTSLHYLRCKDIVLAASN